MSKKDKFFCDKCGACCRNLNMSEVYTTLDRGDGVCRYFNEHTNLCSIYKTRPILCNVELGYKKYFSKIYTEEEYFRLNYEACKFFKSLKADKNET